MRIKGVNIIQENDIFKFIEKILKNNLKIFDLRKISKI